MKRSLRRHLTRRIQKRRLKIKQATWWGYTNLSKNHLGMLKKSHFGCGCSACKGWKSKYYASPKDVKGRNRRLKDSEFRNTTWL